ELIARLWDRECALGRTALLIEWDEQEQRRAATMFAETIRGITLIAGREPLTLKRRRALRVEVERLSTTEQKEIWLQTLGSAASQLDGALGQMVAQFHLGAQAIEAAEADARTQVNGE